MDVRRRCLGSIHCKLGVFACGLGAYGFSAEMLSGLVLAALARVVSETRTVRRGFTIKVERYRITDDGRRALEG